MNYLKLKRQEEAIEVWRQNKGVGTFNHVPRFGKTYEAFLTFEKCYTVNNKIQVVIIVPEKSLIEHWKKSFETYNVNNINLRNVNIVTISSLLNNNDFNLQHNDFVIIDEIHKYFSNERFKSLNVLLSNKPFVLGLTGTTPNNTVEVKKLNSIAPIIDTIKENEALKNKWLSPFNEYNLSLSLSETDKFRYFKFSEKITEVVHLFSGIYKILNYTNLPNDYYFKFKNDYEVIISCLSGKYDLASKQYITGNRIREIIAEIKGWNKNLDLSSNYLRSIEQYWNPDNIKEQCLKFKSFVTSRNLIINESEIKNEAVVKILTNDEKLEKTIIYVSSINQAENLKDRINLHFKKDVCFTFHSQLKSLPLFDFKNNTYFKYKSGKNKGNIKLHGQKSIKDYCITNFENGNLSVLIAVGSLKEGFNIPDLKRVISITGSKDSKEQIQKTARVKTYLKDKVGEIINLYFDDFKYNYKLINSHDKRKLLIRQQENNNDIKFYKFVDYIN